MGRKRGKYAKEWGQRALGLFERVDVIRKELHIESRLDFHVKHNALLDALLRKITVAGEEPGPELQAFLNETSADGEKKPDDWVSLDVERDEGVDPSTVPLPTDDHLREYVRKVHERDERWGAAIKKFASALTDAEKEHAIAYATDREYRRRGDSKMAVSVRRCDEVVRKWKSDFIQKHKLATDVPLMRIYLDMRRATKMFCLSPDDQEAFDLFMGALDRFPAEMKRALRERGVDVA
jgi:hypothetical protein